MTKDIIMLQNKPESFKIFCKLLPPGIKTRYKFHLVVDTRNYNIIDYVTEIASKCGIMFRVYDGKEMLQEIHDYLELGGWFMLYQKSLKIILPIYKD